MAVKYSLILLGTLVAVMHIEAQQQAMPGSCPNYPPMADYDFTKVGGTWYNVYYMTAGRTYNIPCHSSVVTVDEGGYESITVTYKLNGEEKKYRVKNTPDNSKPGKYTVTDTEDVIKYYQTILDSDYENYIVKVRCSNNGNNTYAYLVVVASRKRTLEERYLEQAKRAIENAGFVSNLSKVPQDDC